MSPDDVESMLLMAVDKLYRDEREVDVQLGLLSVVLQVLQRHGESSCQVCCAVASSLMQQPCVGCSARLLLWDTHTALWCMRNNRF